MALDRTEISVAVGTTANLKATIQPVNASNKAVTWNSADKAIATVSTAGLITGKAAGTSVVTVTTADGAKTATCTVTVTAAE